MQLDKGYKGFSFSKEGPLDMRMDPSSDLTAEEVVNTWTEKQLGDLFREYGEERHWRKAAAAIIEARRLQAIRTTQALSSIIQTAFRGKGKGSLHPATLIFQALRLCVNNELESLQMALQQAIRMLSPGGRIGVISFHSLEDRIVKNIFRTASFMPAKRRETASAVLRLLTKKPITASLSEIRFNPRSRSAKLRFAEKL